MVRTPRLLTLCVFLLFLLVQSGSGKEAVPAIQEPAALQPGGTFSDTLSSGGPGPEMVVIPAGTFHMGCVSGVECRDNELPVREVTIPHSFADGSAWLEGDCSRHVIRGGSWRDGPPEMRSAFRFGLANRSGFRGENFRVARVLTP